MALHLESILRPNGRIDYYETENEDSRLQEVERYRYEEMVSSEDFQNFTEIGAYLFGVDLCYIGLVFQNKEKFFSFYGAELDDLKRSCSICTFNILEGSEEMVVENVRKDKRFRYNSKLKELGINSYAGFPLKSPEGEPVGTFCISDRDVNDLDQKEITMLRLLAEEVQEKMNSKYYD